MLCLEIICALLYQASNRKRGEGMEEQIEKIKKWVNILNDKVGFLTLVTTLLFSISIFLFDLLMSRYELGYSSFFGLKKIIELEYDFIGLFFTFFIVLLVFTITFIAINPKYIDIQNGFINKFKKLFCIQTMMLVLTATVFYLYVLTKLVLTDSNILKCIILPLIPLLTMIWVTFVWRTKKNILAIIVTIVLVLIIVLCVNWGIFGVLFDDGITIKVTIFLLLIPLYFTIISLVVDWISRRKDKDQEVSKSDLNNKNKKWNFIHIMVVIFLMFIPIAFILISISSTGWNSAKSTNELYMTEYDNREYILFEQKDHFIAIPVKKLSNDLTSDRIAVQSIENEYKYLNKDTVTVHLIKIEKIERADKENSVIIEFIENKN